MAEVTASTLKARFPAFESAEDSQVAACIADAVRRIQDGWREADREEATKLLAAHFLVEEGAVGGGTSSVSSGQIKRRKIGDAETEWFQDVQSEGQSSDGGLSQTIYGKRYLDLVRVNLGGAAVTG